MFKKFLTASIAASAMTASALAADLPSRAPPPVYAPPPPVMTWTGFYVGVNAGGLFANNNNGNTFSATPGPCNPAFGGCTAVPNYSVTSATALNLAGALNNNGNNSKGALTGGGQIGFNYQIAPSFVVGVEADFQGVAGNNNNNNNNGVVAPISVVNPNFPAFPLTQIGNLNNNNRQQLSYLGTLRGRAGFLATPSLLIYGTGGLAFGGWRNNNNNGIVQIVGPTDAAGTVDIGFLNNNNNNSNNRVGYTAGGGIEWMFLPNWSVKAEALYYDLRRNNNNNNGQLLALTCVGTAAGCAVPGGLFASSLLTQNNTRSNGVIARAGLNYHFNWGAPAPVVARY